MTEMPFNTPPKRLSIPRSGLSRRSGGLMSSPDPRCLAFSASRRYPLAPVRPRASVRPLRRRELGQIVDAELLLQLRHAGDHALEAALAEELVLALLGEHNGVKREA